MQQYMLLSLFLSSESKPKKAQKTLYFGTAGSEAMKHFVVT